MAELTANGLRFHAQVLHGPEGRRPDRPKVVMVHGLSTDMASYYMTIAGSVAVESDVHLYDLRGHGRSEAPRQHYSVADHVADLAGLLDAWDIHDPVHLFSNSFGGIVAFFFAHQYPERVASMFMIEPIPTDEGWGKFLSDVISDAVRDFHLDPVELDLWAADHPERRKWYRRNQSLLLNTSILADLAQETYVPTEWLESLDCPIFSIYGSASVMLDYALARDRLIPGCQPIIIEGGTHMLLAEEEVLIRQHAVEWIRQRNAACAPQNG